MLYYACKSQKGRWLTIKTVAWYRRIGFRLFAVTALLVLLPMLIFWNYSLRSSRSAALAQYAERMHTSLYGASLMMESLMEEAGTLGREVSRDEALQAAVQSYQQAVLTGADASSARSRISLILNEYAARQSSVDSLFIYLPACKSVVSMLPGQKEIRFPEAYAAYFHDLYYNQMSSSLEWRMLQQPGGSRALSLLRPLGNLTGCTLICSVSDSAWKPAFTRLVSEDASCLISDFDGNIVYGLSAGREVGGSIGSESAYAEAFSTLADTGHYSYKSKNGPQLVAYYTSVESAFKYMMLVPENSILSSHGLQPRFYLLLALSGLMSLAVSNLLLNRSLVQPLGLLGSYMNASRSGQMEPVPPRAQQDEPGILFDCYNAMVARQQQLLDEVNIQQLLRKQTQLNYLQSQMDEHFLFNTLNTIYSEACHENAPHSAQMLLVLSRYFRLSLSYGREKLPLNEIADLLRLYLQLQKMRFGPGLTCHLQIFPEMGQYTALKYLFQPIVENAIVHGFEKNPGGHTIRIIFERENDQLRFTVQDDGKGMQPEALAALRAAVNSREAAPGCGYALQNIHEQLCLTYGERDVQLESTPGCGMQVSFCIPLEREGDLS